jgi:hypothetical protein
VMSIGVLTSPAPPEAGEQEWAAAAAKLYGRVLASRSPVAGGGGRVYAAELGVLVRCLCARSGKVVTGEAFEACGGGGVFAGIERDDRAVLDGCLGRRLDGPVAVGYVRFGRSFNAVVGPGEDGLAAVVAEFEPVTGAR